MKNHGESFSIHNLLSGLLNVNSGFPSNQHSPRVNKGAVECPNCHMTYEEFVQIGKFGCAECYKTFSSQLEPIVRRLHSGNAAHTGKIPGRIAGGINLRKQIDELRAELQKCIQKEEFEKAVTLRDEIRKLESEYHTPAEGSDS
ncbi:MAG: UvrB/UvrC motif-containing protein [Bacillus sp. (in: firmicutes)]